MIQAIGYLVLACLTIVASAYVLGRKVAVAPLPRTGPPGPTGAAGRPGPTGAAGPPGVSHLDVELLARVATIQALTIQYGVTPAELRDLNDPNAMEERAKRLVAERELARVSELLRIETQKQSSTPSASDKEDSHPKRS